MNRNLTNCVTTSHGLPSHFFTNTNKTYLNEYTTLQNRMFPLIRVTHSSPGQVSLRFLILLSPQQPVSMTTARFPSYPLLNTVKSGWGFFLKNGNITYLSCFPRWWPFPVDLWEFSDDQYPDDIPSHYIYLSISISVEKIKTATKN